MSNPSALDMHNRPVNIGDTILSTPDSTYSCLIGKAMDTEGGAIIVDFTGVNYLVESKRQLCTGLKRKRKPPLRAVPMYPQQVLSLASVSEETLADMVEKEGAAERYCYGELLKIANGKIIENGLNIAMNAGYLIGRDTIEVNDMMELQQNILQLAEKFEGQYHATSDYWEAIDQFSRDELLAIYGE